MNKSTDRLEAWGERWDRQEAIDNLDEVVAVVEAIGELVPAKYDKEFAALYAEAAARVGAAMRPHEARLDALLRGSE